MIKYKYVRKKKTKKKREKEKRKEQKIWEGMGIYVRHIFSIVLVKAAAPCLTFKIFSLRIREKILQRCRRNL